MPLDNILLCFIYDYKELLLSDVHLVHDSIYIGFASCTILLIALINKLSHIHTNYLYLN